MPNHPDDPPCPECGEKPGALLAKIEQLTGEKRRALQMADERSIENIGLRSDIERHVAITATQQQEIERLQRGLMTVVERAKNDPEARAYEMAKIAATTLANE